VSKIDFTSYLGQQCPSKKSDPDGYAGKPGNSNDSNHRVSLHYGGTRCNGNTHCKRAGMDGHSRVVAQCFTNRLAPDGLCASRKLSENPVLFDA